VARPVPFRVMTKGKPEGPWKAIVGKTLEELAPETSTLEEAQKKLDVLLESLPKTKFSLFSKTSTEQTKLPDDSFSVSSNDSTTEKPKTGDIVSNGLASLTPARVAKFREQIAGALATGNVSLDRALVCIFRDDVPVIPPEQYLMLAVGWELACEQYFKNGVPPPWIIILLGNVIVSAKLIELSKPKPEPKPEAITDEATKVAVNG
jgi:hypothetical protein